MKKSTLRVLAIALVIAVPAFFFLLFKPLSKVPRPKSPPKMFSIGVDKYKDAKGKEVIDSLYHLIPNAIFTNHQGEEFQLDSLYGNVYVLDFFFVTCRGICPIMTKQMKRVQDAFIKDRNVKLVSISVDSERDSISVLREYARNNGAVPGKWSFLNGPKEEVYNLARDGFFLVAKENPGGEDAFLHSEKLVLVDAEGHIRGFYNGVDSTSVNKLMSDMVLVLREYERNYSFRKNPKERGSVFTK
jgi:protein SCO1/2